MKCIECGAPVKPHGTRVVKFCSRLCANMVTGRARRSPDAQRFWAKVERRGECLIWTAATAGEGDYGYFWYQGKLERAHRASWMMAHGVIADGLFVLHYCDTPECVLPEHLFLGTHVENMQDREAKGRTRNGDGRYRKVTETRGA